MCGKLASLLGRAAQALGQSCQEQGTCLKRHNRKEASSTWGANGPTCLMQFIQNMNEVPDCKRV